MHKYKIVLKPIDIPLADGVLTDLGRIEKIEEKQFNLAVKLMGKPWDYEMKDSIHPIEIYLQDLDTLAHLTCSDALQDQLLEMINKGVREINQYEFELDLYTKDGKFGHTIAIPLQYPTIHRSQLNMNGKPNIEPFTLSEKERNKRLFRLLDKLIGAQDMETIQLLETMVRNDTESMKKTYHIMIKQNQMPWLETLKAGGSL